MAEVFAARLVGSGGFEKVVALKRMLRSLADDPRFVAMFLDEARLAARIESPHVVQTLELGQADDGSLFLVMELVVGLPLNVLGRAVRDVDERIPPDVAVDIIIQAASGLHDAHEATTSAGQPLELVHRDVSPQNILVGRDGRVRIMDFGIAKALQRSTHTATGELKGKLAYFAPEQAAADRTIDRRADVFALGIVAWECLTGERLFRGDNPFETVCNLMECKVPLVHERRSDVPVEVDRVLARALARDRSARFPTAEEFASALREALPPASRATTATYVRNFGAQHIELFEAALRSALDQARTGEDGIATTLDQARTGEDGIATTLDPRGPSGAAFDNELASQRHGRSSYWTLIAVATLLAIAGVGFALASWGGQRAGREGPRVRTSAPPAPLGAGDDIQSLPRSMAAMNEPPTAAAAGPDGDVSMDEVESIPVHEASKVIGSPSRGLRPTRRPRASAPPEPSTSSANTPLPEPSTAMTIRVDPTTIHMEPAPHAPGLQGIEDFERHLR